MLSFFNNIKNTTKCLLTSNNFCTYTFKQNNKYFKNLNKLIFIKFIKYKTIKKTDRNAGLNC